MTADDDAFAEHLAALDEALAAGNTVPAGETPNLRGRLARGLHALHALHDLRPPDAGRRPAPPADAPHRIGRFDIVRELGRGGFGVVFLARDPALHREVALKLPHPTVLDDAGLRDRFRREALAAAGLDHPNIVPVYEVDDAGPVPYIASAYVAGPNLAVWLRDHPALPAGDAARLVATLADAVAFAHDKGVIHRDLKPANILLASEAAPRITDFGLAKLLADPAGPTRSGTAMGTPSYMSPEQAGGRSGDVGPATDVYALGAILYELLTGRPPFRGESDAETVRQVCDLDPVPPRRLRPALPRDLDTVCLKCLEKDPARRYPSATALADDLRRVLDGRPTAARPVGVVGRGARLARRKPLIAGLSAALVAAVAIGTAGVGVEYRRAERERDAAVAERDKTGRLLDQARGSLGEMIELGHSLVHSPPTVGQGLDILTVARKYHNSLLAEEPDNVPIREQAVLICKRFAMIQGEKKDWSAANAAWAEAADHVEALMAGPDGAKRRAEFVELLVAWAEPLFFNERYAEALAAAERALPVARDLDAERPDDPAAGHALVRCSCGGGALWRTGHWPAAASALREGLAVVRRGGPAFADRYGVGVENNFLCRLAEAYAAHRDFAASEGYAREAVTLLRAAVERRPADVDLTLKLAGSLNVLGRPLFATKQWQGAVDVFREANRLFLTRPDLTAFSNGGYQAFQRGATAIALALTELGRPDEASPDLVAAVRLPPPPPRAGRQNSTPPELFECYVYLIETALRRGEPATARKLHAEALGRLPPPQARSGGAIEKWARLLTDLGPKLPSEPAAK